MIIYGWKTTQKMLGKVGSFQCGVCNNESPYDIIKVTSWFTLFFIPIIPYRFKYYMLCPICQRGKELSKDEAYGVLEDIGHINQIPR